jgi:hypothetical protein
MILHRAIAAGVVAPIWCHSFGPPGLRELLRRLTRLQLTMLHDRTDEQFTLNGIEKDFGCKGGHSSVCKNCTLRQNLCWDLVSYPGRLD